MPHRPRTLTPNPNPNPNDKGEANGAPFCYFGAEPVGCTDTNPNPNPNPGHGPGPDPDPNPNQVGCTGERARRVAAYALAVLDALE